MNNTSKKFLYTYLNNFSPTGFESSGQKIWLEYIKPYIHNHIVDVYGSVAGVINPDKKYKVVIEAHADEISWFIKYVSDDGYLYVRRNGGSDHQIAPSKRVTIFTETGMVKGIFGWPAIHVRDDKKEENPSLKNLFIDVGAKNKKEVEEMGIHAGSVVVFEDELIEMNKKFLVGRGLDNRIGGFVIAEVARKISENNIQLPFSLYIVNSVQEEIGLRGAEMMARRINPDVAIITDVGHDTTSPLYDKKDQGEIGLGKGPILTYGPAVQNNLLKMIIDIAQKKNIPFQRTSVSRSTGTDTDAFAYAGNGSSACALISIPLKYMHTTVEMADKTDIDNVINLMYEFLIQLQEKHNFRYIQ
ncbi:MAG: M42 family metallopeptidase [Chitinophagaceae bacterium]|nr:M42 family metallopeptidase [Chitinophagaceae bacterium]